jgi:peptidoglycan/xylan/chitin deacetylase (PgdA/CDA1 family)
VKINIQRCSAKTIGRLLTGGQDRRLAILCYHSIHPANSFALHPRVFESHLAWLAEYCEVIPFDQVLRKTEEDAARPRVAVTFDDGYLDNYEIALPLLMKYGLTATFFITTGLIDRSPSVIDRLTEEWQAAKGEVIPMSWSQVRELRDAGMGIGAHTRSHPCLMSLNAEKARAELVESKAILEDQCGVSISTLSYPYGGFGSAVDLKTIEIAQEAGYKQAGVVQYRGVRPSDSLLRLPRFVTDVDSPETVSHKILGWWDMVTAGALRGN